LDPTSILDVRNLSVWYDRTEVLRDVSFAVPEHGIVALLGGNGSGKSTILNALSGLVKPRGGSVLVAGKEAIGAPSDQMVRLGVVQVPQGREVFASMTVRDNLELGAATLKGRGVTQTVLGEVLELFPALREASSRRAGSLSGGQQQQLALGRALMSQPRVLLMDEPSAGLAPNIVHALIQTIALLNRNGLAILLVEQNVGVAAAVAETAHVLQNGAIAYTGPASQLINNAEVLASYLGR
jgi:branched-chain amino acid transport system ATP-binding protein